MDKLAYKKRWVKEFQTAQECDVWGQTIEASEKYEALAKLLMKHVKEMSLSSEEENILTKLATCFQLRANSLISLEKDRAFTLEDIKYLTDILELIFTPKAINRFPIDLNLYADKISRLGADTIERRNSNASKLSSFSVTQSATSSMAEQKTSEVIESFGPNTLARPPVFLNNKTYLVFEIEKLGIKDADTYIDSMICVTVVDSEGKVLEQTQNTSVSNKKKLPYILFGQSVYIQTPLEQLDDACIFFEFKHYKPVKKYISTKSFSFMEKDELKESNNIQLELYAKPTDFTRKKVNLLSVKPLYLHLKLTFKKS